MQHQLLRFRAGVTRCDVECVTIRTDAAARKLMPIALRDGPQTRG